MLQVTSTPTKRRQHHTKSLCKWHSTRYIFGNNKHGVLLQPWRWDRRGRGTWVCRGPRFIRSLWTMAMQVLLKRTSQCCKTLIKTTQDLMSRRAYGVSVSLDPALRAPVRPGVGILQVFSQGCLVCLVCWRFFYRVLWCLGGFLRLKGKANSGEMECFFQSVLIWIKSQERIDFKSDSSCRLKEDPLAHQATWPTWTLASRLWALFFLLGGWCGGGLE